MGNLARGHPRRALPPSLSSLPMAFKLLGFLVISIAVTGGLRLLYTSCSLSPRSRNSNRETLPTGTVSPALAQRLLINYAHNCCVVAQRNSCQAALQHGADRCIQYNRSSLDPVFTSRNYHSLSLPRGAGYWVWKPYLILKTLLEEMQDGDLLLYADADSTTIGDLSSLYGLAAGGGESFAPGGIVDDLLTGMLLEQGGDPDGSITDVMKWTMAQQEVHLFQFPGNFVEACWTKADAFLLLNCTDENICQRSAQVDAGFSVWRRGRQSIQFAGQWLGYMEDPRVATDMPNQLGKENHACFMDHRHDQSALGLLAKRWGLMMWEHGAVEKVVNHHWNKN